jgi:hypothetical protein
MKRLIGILLVALVAIAASAQDKRVTFDRNQSYVDFTTTARDSVSNYDTLWQAKVIVNKDFDFDYDAMVSLTHVSGTPDMTVILKARIFEEDAYDTLETFYHLTAVDTVIRWAETTNKRYRELMYDLEENGTAKTLVEDLKLKIWR